MTTIVTVSANTAAFAMEALKPPARKGAKTAVEDSARTARSAEEDAAVEPTLPPQESIRAVSARLAMLNNRGRDQQTTLREAVEAYRKSGA